jgi:hypothetical protein
MHAAIISHRAERFHGVVNQRIKRKRVYSFPRRLNILYDENVLKAQVHSGSDHRQLTESVTQIKNLNTCQRSECHNQECADFCKMMIILRR